MVQSLSWKVLKQRSAGVSEWVNAAGPTGAGELISWLILVKLVLVVLIVKVEIPLQYFLIIQYCTWGFFPGDVLSHWTIGEILRINIKSCWPAIIIDHRVDVQNLSIQDIYQEKSQNEDHLVWSWRCQPQQGFQNLTTTSTFLSEKEKKKKNTTSFDSSMIHNNITPPWALQLRQRPLPSLLCF